MSVDEERPIGRDRKHRRARQALGGGNVRELDERISLRRGGRSEKRLPQERGKSDNPNEFHDTILPKFPSSTPVYLSIFLSPQGDDERRET